MKIRSREKSLLLLYFIQADAIANVSGGSTVKYFDEATGRGGQVKFSDSTYPNPIAAIAPSFSSKDTIQLIISRYYNSPTEHYWIARSPTTNIPEGILVRIFYI